MWPACLSLKLFDFFRARLGKAGQGRAGREAGTRKRMEDSLRATSAPSPFYLQVGTRGALRHTPCYGFMPCLLPAAFGFYGRVLNTASIFSNYAFMRFFAVPRHHSFPSPPCCLARYLPTCRARLPPPFPAAATAFRLSRMATPVPLCPHPRAHTERQTEPQVPSTY